MDFHADNATEAWDEVLARVEGFVAQWDQREPTIEEFLYEDDPTAVRQLILQELIKIDLEYRLAKGEEIRLEQYLERYPELHENGAPSGLIYEEYHLRRAHGSDVKPEEYRQRFPDQSAVITKLLGLDTPTLSTSVRKMAPRLDLDSGQQFDDFDLLVKFGAGAFGAVFLARQRSMQRLVALKVTSDQGAEPQTLAKLDHGHIVRVYDQREAPEHGLWLMYMEFLPGGAMDRVCKMQKGLPSENWNGGLILQAVRRSALAFRSSADGDRAREQLRRAPWPEIVCRLGAELAAALDYAHRHDTLHRDIKPANVLLSADATPKLADFNTSYCSKVEGATPNSYFGGSLPYMSPEQLEAFNPRHERTADQLDGRADLYSLGVMLWELLTGAKPFGQEKLSGDVLKDLEVMTERRRSAPPDPEGFTDAMSRAVARTSVVCMDPDPDLRPSDGAELADRLRLGLNPRAMLVFNSAEAWPGRYLLKAPISLVMFVLVLPNLLAAVLNFLYNRAAIISELGDREGALTAFDRTQATINLIAFPLGIACMIRLCWPICKALAAAKSGDASASAPYNWLAYRALHLGHYAALIGVALWAVAGVAYPISIHAALGHFPMGGYLHFAASLVFCGLIAAAYPFFAAAGLVMRSLYPWLWRQSQSSPDVWNPIAALLSVKRLSAVYLLLAAGAPLLALLCLAPLRCGDEICLRTSGRF